jgi:hypothetical protein
MHTKQHRKGGLAVALITAAVLLVGAAGPVAASDYHLDFPAGVACDFAVGVDIDVVGPQSYREFTDSEGNVLWTLAAGRGNTLTFTNQATGETLALMATGAVNKTFLHPDGSMTQVLTGMNVLIMFPTDVPAGPSTTLYVGRVVVDFDASYNTTIRNTSGAATDICAALAG